jgi:hypothetical protein
VTWSEIFLGVIALATFTMAGTQLGVLVYALIVARRLLHVLDRIEPQVQPLVQSINAIARDTSRVSSLAAGQMERVDGLLTDLTVRIEQTAVTLQDAVIKPIREGTALLAGVRAFLEIFHEVRKGPRGAKGRGDDDDPLFVG